MSTLSFFPVIDKEATRVDSSVTRKRKQEHDESILTIQCCCSNSPLQCLEEYVDSANSLRIGTKGTHEIFTLRVGFIELV